MSTAFFQSGEIELPPGLAPLRSHAAVVRALLDEFDRLAPLSARSSEAAQFAALGGQLAEEIGRLGGRMLECAAAMTGMPSKPGAGSGGTR
jgi:hypothetical protein